MAHEHHIVMLGASGAVGSEVVKTLLSQASLGQLTLLGRRASPQTNEKVERHVVLLPHRMNMCWQVMMLRFAPWV